MCVKLLEQGLVANITCTPQEPIFALGNLGCQKIFMYWYFPMYKYLWIQVTWLAYAWKGWGSSTSKKSLSLCCGSSFLLHSRQSHYFQEKIRRRISMLASNPTMELLHLQQETHSLPEMLHSLLHTTPMHFPRETPWWCLYPQLKTSHTLQMYLFHTTVWNTMERRRGTKPEEMLKVAEKECD